jgi:1-aminocyclopropane-1-carboxylate deaminase/D-cysteine desulfhydrase
MIAAKGIKIMMTDSVLNQELKDFVDFLPEIDSCKFEFAQQKLVSIDCLRLDKIHPFVSGNKWYKLKYSILHGYQAGKTQFLSFGGAYSNHLHALAYAGKHLKIKTIGVVRGERVEPLNPTLQDCQDWGMELYWVPREQYRQFASSSLYSDSVSTSAKAHFLSIYPDACIIPEGGAGSDGVLGVESLFNALHHQGNLDYDFIITPVGSGTTLAGIARAKVGRAKCLGFSALKGASDLERRVESQLAGASRINPWSIAHDYHFGGFAKTNARLTRFISDTYKHYSLLLDPIYTGKMLYGLAEYIYQGRIPSGSKVLILHTGGLQGWRGFADLHPQNDS